MIARQLALIAVSILVGPLSGAAAAQQVEERYVRIAEIEIDLAQLDAYKAAVAEHAAVAIRDEPGVLVLHAVAEKDSPTRIKIFEVYASTTAYRAHLEAPHFKRYKAVTESIVKSLKLLQVTLVALFGKMQRKGACDY